MKIQKIQTNLFSNNYKNFQKRTRVKSFQDKNSNIINNVTNTISPNYYNLSFGAVKTQSAISAAKDLKAKYLEKGLNYLLPKEVWSSKKIFNTIDTIANEFDKLEKSKKINAKALNTLVKTLIPAAVASKIEVKDFKELRADLLDKGYDEDAVNMYLMTSAAITGSDENQSTIYVKNNVKTPEESVGLKVSFTHELKHALTNLCTNINSTDKFNNKDNPDKSVNESQFYNSIFSNFQRFFDVAQDGRNVELTTKDMLLNTSSEKMGKDYYKSEKELFEDMDTAMAFVKTNTVNASISKALPKLLDFGLVDFDIVSQITPKGILNDEVIDILCKINPDNELMIRKVVDKYKLPKNAFNTKHFWETMQHMAADEKEAYTTNKYYRELNGNLEQPLDFEHCSMLYEKMENFFKQKAQISKG